MFVSLKGQGENIVLRLSFSSDLSIILDFSFVDKHDLTYKNFAFELSKVSNVLIIANFKLFTFQYYFGPEFIIRWWSYKGTPWLIGKLVHIWLYRHLSVISVSSNFHVCIVLNWQKLLKTFFTFNPIEATGMVEINLWISIQICSKGIISHRKYLCIVL